MHFFTAIFLLIGILTGCQNSTSPTEKENKSYPPLPSPVVYVIPEQEQSYFSHPWLRTQPNVKSLSSVIKNDLDSMNAVHILLNKQRQIKGLEQKSTDADAQAMTDILLTLQKPLKDLPIHFPSGFYSLLNLPETPQIEWNTPFSFQILKRVHLGETELALPFYVDVHVFDSPLENDPESIQRIRDWYFNLLSAGASSFQKLPVVHVQAWVGKGFRSAHYQQFSHGFATQERKLLFALIPREGRIYVIFAEGSLKAFEEHQELLFSLFG